MSIGNSNLVKRVLSAIAIIVPSWWIVNADISLLPAGLARHFPLLVNSHLYPGHIMGMVLVLIASAEYLGMLKHWYPRNGFWVLYVWLVLQFIDFFVPSRLLSAKYDTYLLLILVAAEAMLYGRKSERWKRASLFFSGGVFLSIAGFSVLNFYNGSLQEVFPRQFGNPMLSQMGLVTVCAAVFGCDTAAYFIGSWFGKHHFSSISPHKTIEGSIAGFAAAVLASVGGWAFFADTVRYPLWLSLIMGVLVGVFAQAGDLLVSTMKRYFRVKDSSNLIPGHGGVLDRFDSVFFAAPILNLFFMIVTRIYD